MCHILADFGGSLARLKASYAALARLAFRPGTDANHERQGRLYLDFCQHHHLRALDPLPSTICYYITYLAGRFTAANSVRNYISGIRFLHKQCGSDFQALDSFQVSCLLRATDMALRRPPNRKAPLTPELLTQLVALTPQLGELGPVMKVALLFGFFGMLRMSNLAPASPQSFDHSRHTCRGDIFTKPPGLVLLLKWSKTLQDLGTTPLIPLPQMIEHPMCPLQAYAELVAVSPTRHPNQPLLTRPQGRGYQLVCAPLLTRLLKDMLAVLSVDPDIYSFHSLRRGGATAAFHAGVTTMDIKRHGIWSSDCFWAYITAPVVAASPVALALAQAVQLAPHP